MRHQRLYCKMCHSALSETLRLDDQVRAFRFGSEDDSIKIPFGEAWIFDIQPIRNERSEDTVIWFSPHSLTNQVVTDQNAFGCCGYFGRDNTRCGCGHIAGSRVDECARQPRFEPNLKMTYWASADLSEAGRANG